ncbi:hypothetical protein MNBD_GAMMA11-151, partial [hydrothermal vent metagenome]
MHTLVNKLPKALQPDALNLATINQTLPPVLMLLLTIACSYTLAQITWAFFPDDDQQAAAPHNLASSQQNAQKAPDFSHISD